MTSLQRHPRPNKLADAKKNQLLTRLWLFLREGRRQHWTALLCPGAVQDRWRIECTWCCPGRVCRSQFSLMLSLSRGKASQTCPEESGTTFLPADSEIDSKRW